MDRSRLVGVSIRPRRSDRCADHECGGYAGSGCDDRPGEGRGGAAAPDAERLARVALTRIADPGDEKVRAEAERIACA